MENQIDEETAKERFNRLLEHVNAGVEKISESLVGTVENVLVEEVNRQDPKMVTGRTERNSLVHFEGSEELIGQVVPVKIIQNKIFYFLFQNTAPSSVLLSPFLSPLKRRLRYLKILCQSKLISGIRCMLNIRRRIRQHFQV